MIAAGPTFTSTEFLTQQVIEFAKPIAWHSACHLNDILPFTGVAALVEGLQVAVFRVDLDGKVETFALSNYDPFSHAYVLARGLVGDKKGVLKVASPIYKQNFNLRTGQCLDDESVCLATWPTRIVDGLVQIGM